MFWRTNPTLLPRRQQRLMKWQGCTHKVGIRKHTPVCACPRSWSMWLLGTDTDKQTRLDRDGCRQKEGHWLSCIPLKFVGVSWSKITKEVTNSTISIQKAKKKFHFVTRQLKKAFLRFRELHYKTHYYTKKFRDRRPLVLYCECSLNIPLSIWSYLKAIRLAPGTPKHLLSPETERLCLFNHPLNAKRFDPHAIDKSHPKNEQKRCLEKPSTIHPS